MLNIFFAAVINVAYLRFKANKDIMDALVILRKKTGAWGRVRATSGEPVLKTSLWGMLYDDDDGVVFTLARSAEEEYGDDCRRVRCVWRSPRTQTPGANSRGTRDNAVPLRHAKPARVTL